MSLVKSETNDDGQLPAGWHLLTCWHFTAGRFNCLTKPRAAVSANAERRQTFTRAKQSTRAGIVFAFARMWEIQR